MLNISIPTTKQDVINLKNQVVASNEVKIARAKTSSWLSKLAQKMQETSLKIAA